MSTIIVPAAASASTAIYLRACFVNRERTSARLLAVQTCNGLGSFVVIGHLDKSKSPRATGVAVRYQGDAFDVAVGLKESPKLCFCHAETEITYKYLLHIFRPILSFVVR